MPFSGMLHSATRIITKVSEEDTASIIRVTIGELATTFLRRKLRFLVTANVVPSPQILVILMMEEIRTSETLIYSFLFYITTALIKTILDR
jgi:hypothetical protein